MSPNFPVAGNEHDTTVCPVATGAEPTERDFAAYTSTYPLVVVVAETVTSTGAARNAVDGAEMPTAAGERYAAVRTSAPTSDPSLNLMPTKVGRYVEAVIVATTEPL